MHVLVREYVSHLLTSGAEGIAHQCYTLVSMKHYVHHVIIVKIKSKIIPHIVRSLCQFYFADQLIVVCFCREPTVCWESDGNSWDKELEPPLFWLINCRWTKQFQERILDCLNIVVGNYAFFKCWHEWDISPRIISPPVFGQWSITPAIWDQMMNMRWQDDTTLF